MASFVALCPLLWLALWHGFNLPARALEQGSATAKAGLLTREKALRMVNDILRLAGLDDLAPVPSLDSTFQAISEKL